MCLSPKESEGPEDDGSERWLSPPRGRTGHQGDIRPHFLLELSELSGSSLQDSQKCELGKDTLEWLNSAAERKKKYIKAKYDLFFFNEYLCFCSFCFGLSLRYRMSTTMIYLGFLLSITKNASMLTEHKRIKYMPSAFQKQLFFYACQRVRKVRGYVIFFFLSLHTYKFSQYLVVLRGRGDGEVCGSSARISDISRRHWGAPVAQRGQFRALRDGKREGFCFRKYSLLTFSFPPVQFNMTESFSVDFLLLALAWFGCFVFIS